MAIAASFPNLRPSLLLDFANAKAVDPRITFTRSTTAKYYDGVTTAKAEENLLLWSQEFGNGVWSKARATVTTNTEIAPDGTTTAETFAATDVDGEVFQTASLVGEFTFSVWIKRKTGTGDVSLRFSSGVGSVVAVTSDWQRFSFTATRSGSSFITVRLATSGDEVYLWGAQLEQRSAVTAYTPTTTQPITNYIPVLQTAAAGQARFDHNPTTGEALGLLIEEQRTNLVTYSEEFGNAAWSKVNATVTDNIIVAPDGALTGDNLVANISVAQHRIDKVVSGGVGGTTYTLSVFAKRAGYDFCILRTGDGSLVTFDLANGTVTAASPATGKIETVGDGWYRCSASQVLTTSGNITSRINVSNTNGISDFSGDGYSGIYIWGAQLEVGAFPTSYIATTSAQVTRNADAASMTGADFSSWYNAGEGTLYGEVSARSALSFGRIADLTATDGNAGSIRAYYDTSVSPARIGWTTSINSAQDFNVIPAVSVGETTARFAGVYANNSAQAAVNGIAGTEDTSCRVAQGINQLILGASVTGASRISGHIRKLAYYPIRVTNAQLQALTA